MRELSGAEWRKSTRSNGGTGGACVEVADNLPGVVAIRDSKDPAGAALTVDPSYWSRFTATLKSNAFDL